MLAAPPKPVAVPLAAAPELHEASKVEVLPPKMETEDGLAPKIEGLGCAEAADDAVGAAEPKPNTMPVAVELEDCAKFPLPLD